MDTLFVRITPKAREEARAAAAATAAAIEQKEKETEEGAKPSGEQEEGKEKDTEKEVEGEKKDETQEEVKNEEGKDKEPTPTEGANGKDKDGKGRTRTKSMVHKKDCNLVFAHLCTLSNPPVTKDSKGSDKDKEETRSRLLALELIDFLLEGLWQGLEDNPHFINEHIKKNLCMSLSTNATHPNVQVFSYALSITLSLIKYFRHLLKEEIRVFLSVYLRILESNNASIQQKSLIVDFIRKMCQDPQILCDIFVNYDCDLDHGDVFDSIVNRLSKIVTMGTVAHKANTKESNEEHNIELQKLGLQSLVSILNSIVDWSAELYEPPKLHEVIRNFSSTTATEQEGAVVAEEEIIDPAERASESDLWQQNKEKKLLMDQGKRIFALKAKKGIEFFQTHGFVDKTPDSLAAFLFETPNLDKVQIGQLLGDPKGVPTLHAYVDNHFDFSGKDLDIAMRHFLSCFWLPGEAMQIDRIMEKFAEKFFRDNNNLTTETGEGKKQYYANADSVFTLAFATIMLATDRHSEMIKDKIELSQWQHNLRGLNNDADFDPELLAQIFARIDAEAFKVTSDEFADSSGNNAFLTEKERQSAFLDEAEQMAEKAQALIKNALSSKSTYFKATNIQYVKPMFQVTWGALLAAFSLSLEHTQDAEIMELCIRGLRHSIRVSNIFYMSTEQSAFISALTKFCNVQLEEVEEKHLVAINTLIEIALEDGNYLRGCWVNVLRVLSQLDRMHEYASGLPTNHLLDHEVPAATPVNPNSPEAKAQKLYDYNARVITANIPMDKIDSVFVISKELSNSGILDLVSGVCVVSVEEIQQEKPSLFSIKKMVELAVDNMRYRKRIVWNRVWKTLANHFTFAGCQKNRKIAVFAIDSLRLIAMKFLEFEELANYNFQNEFLKPFEEVAKTRSRQVREHVIDCLCTMITALPKNIKSGWACIFNVFASQAILSSNESVVKKSFDMTHQIVTNYFEHVSKLYFGDLVQCLASYASSKKDDELSVKAIKSMKLCSKKLSTFCKPETESPQDIQRWNNQWLSLVNAFVRTILTATVDNRRVALNTMFSVLKTEGVLFDTLLWKYLFEQGVWHLFDKLKTVTADTKEDWLLTESSDLFKALHGVISLFDTFFEVIHSLLPDVLALMATFIESKNEHLATFGTTSLETLLQNNGRNFSHQDWSQVTQSLKNVLRQSLIPQVEASSEVSSETSGVPGAGVGISREASPTRAPEDEVPASSAPVTPKKVVVTPKKTVVSGSPRTPGRTSSVAEVMMKVVIGKCEVRKQLLHLVRDLILKSFFTCLTLPQINELMECMQRTYDNSNIALENDNFFDVQLKGLDTRQLVVLLNEVASDSMYCYFDFLFRLEEEEEPERIEIAKTFLVNSCESLIQTYMGIVAQFVDDATTDEVKHKKSSRKLLNPRSEQSSSIFGKKERMSVAMNGTVPILVLILTKLLTYSDEKLSSVLHSLYPLLCDLILSDSYQVRLLLRQIVWRVGIMNVPEFEQPFRPNLAVGVKRLANSPNPVARSTRASEKGEKEIPVTKEELKAEEKPVTEESAVRVVFNMNEEDLKKEEEKKEEEEEKDKETEKEATVEEDTPKTETK
eukprot:TRINITY_DN2209_c0_g1_i4.p1 TRINITY_DN2209_c0_g1~~TRINITY_DN2209_c0_g1_i4.p1  ORF type:complete len:1805 (-),score=476.17 TRINITY_DN2209_c0_g1_i4:124-4893(-)